MTQQIVQQLIAFPLVSLWNVIFHRSERIASMAQELPHSTLENHPDHVKAIGMITIEMSNLDMSLGEMLGGLLTVPPTVGRTIYLTPRAATARLDILTNTAREALEVEGEGLRLTNSLIKRARRLMDKRHNYIHNLWAVGKEDQSIVHSLAMPIDTSGDPPPVPLKNLTQMISDIRTLNRDIIRMTSRMYREISARESSGQTPPVQPSPAQNGKDSPQED